MDIHGVVGVDENNSSINGVKAKKRVPICGGLVAALSAFVGATAAPLDGGACKTHKECTLYRCHFYKVHVCEDGMETLLAFECFV